VGETLELTDEARERLQELQALSDKVESGGKGAVLELRRAVEKSSSEVVTFCASIAQDYRRLAAATGSGGDPLVREAMVEGAESLTKELAGENPSPLELRREQFDLQCASFCPGLTITSGPQLFSRGPASGKGRVRNMGGTPDLQPF
jgi:hypothetical protein